MSRTRPTAPQSTRAVRASSRSRAPGAASRASRTEESRLRGADRRPKRLELRPRRSIDAPGLSRAMSDSVLPHGRIVVERGRLDEVHARSWRENRREMNVGGSIAGDQRRPLVQSERVPTIVPDSRRDGASRSRGSTRTTAGVFGLYSSFRRTDGRSPAARRALEKARCDVDDRHALRIAKAGQCVVRRTRKTRSRPSSR